MKTSAYILLSDVMVLNTERVQDGDYKSQQSTFDCSLARERERYTASCLIALFHKCQNAFRRQYGEITTVGPPGPPIDTTRSKGRVLSVGRVWSRVRVWGQGMSVGRV